MKNHDRKEKATALRRIMDGTTQGSTKWSDEDLRDMLRHQLTVPLATDIVPVVEQAEATLSMEATQAGAPASFGELLAQPQPPLALLRLMKNFAKNLLKAGEQEMPKELLQVLYYAAIVTALVKRRTRITELKDASLREGCAWCLTRKWLTRDLQLLFEKGATELA